MNRKRNGIHTIPAYYKYYPTFAAVASSSANIIRFISFAFCTLSYKSRKFLSSKSTKAPTIVPTIVAIVSVSYPMFTASMTACKALSLFKAAIPKAQGTASEIWRPLPIICDNFSSFSSLLPAPSATVSYTHLVSGNYFI